MRKSPEKMPCSRSMSSASRSKRSDRTNRSPWPSCVTSVRTGNGTPPKRLVDADRVARSGGLGRRALALDANRRQSRRRGFRLGAGHRVFADLQRDGPRDAGQTDQLRRGRA